MNLILVKNSPKEELKLKSEIKKYLENNFPKDEVIYIYMYSYSTSYFIDNEEEKSGMMSSHFLSEYEKDFGIGQFFVEGYLLVAYFNVEYSYEIHSNLN